MKTARAGNTFTSSSERFKSVRVLRKGETSINVGITLISLNICGEMFLGPGDCSSGGCTCFGGSFLCSVTGFFVVLSFFL